MRRTHLMRRSPSAFGEDGFAPISFSFYRFYGKHTNSGLGETLELRTECKPRLALYTASMLRNIESSSAGGKFERDHAAATF